ncbi:recombinase family protein [Pengzhenrongella phosphoraccumulans]|uniref:recombinase family protein n=1 Tax=Pengzhenrongella phosphoraccumulans TaxID=3114394 RepID=UPI00388F838D
MTEDLPGGAPTATSSTRSSGHSLGYARVSTVTQDEALQLDALPEAGCERIWVDHASGRTMSRPELDLLLGTLLPGDVLTVWRLDRLGRDLRDLLALVAELNARGVIFRSLREAIDTSTPSGRLVLAIFASLAEFERELIRERTLAGLEAARARGRVGGRPTVMTPIKLRAARALISSGATVTQASAAIDVSRASLYRAFSAENPKR